MINEYIKSIMNRNHEAKSKLSIILNYSGVIIINQSFVLNCFFLKKMYNLLKVLVPSIEKFDEFYKKLTEKIDLSDVTTSFSMEEIKQTSNLPLNYI